MHRHCLIGSYFPTGALFLPAGRSSFPRNPIRENPLATGSASFSAIAPLSSTPVGPPPTTTTFISLFISSTWPSSLPVSLPQNCAVTGGAVAGPPRYSSWEKHALRSVGCKEIRIGTHGNDQGIVTEDAGGGFNLLFSGTIRCTSARRMRTLRAC